MTAAARDRLLIVDDETSFALSTTALLSKQGFDCSPAFSGEEALKLLSENEFDSVLCDINMSGNRDLELTSEITQRYSSTPLILITGYPTVETAVRAMSLSVFDYVLKPFVFDKLLGTVRAATSRSKILKTVHASRDRMESTVKALNDHLRNLTETGRSGLDAGIASYITLMQENVLKSLSDMYSIMRAATAGDDCTEVMTLLDCPPLRDQRKLLEETVQILEKTKSAFKSKDLALLRQRIERFLNETSH